MGLVLRVILYILGRIAWLVNSVLAHFLPRERPKYAPIRNKLLMKSVAELVQDLQRRKITSEQLVTTYIERIKEVNPALNAVIEARFEDALREANAADQLIINSASNVSALYARYPLLGIPATIKEAIGVKGLSFCVGSKKRLKQKRSANSEVVDSLRSVGCIPLLVSANPEFCLSYETHTKTHGIVNNPYDLYRTPGGSSGGEAALIGSGASVFGVGSDIAGAIRLPALFCGIFGHKPTGGLLSVKGHFPYSCTDPLFPYYMQTGPMTRFARDLPLLLRVMAGDKADKLNAAENVPIEDIKIFYAFGFNGLNGFTHGPVDLSIQFAIHKAVAYFKKGGLTTEQIKLKSCQNTLEVCLANFFSMKGIPSIITQSSIKRPWTFNILYELLKSLLGFSNYSKDALFIELLFKMKGCIFKKRLPKLHSELENIRVELTKQLGTRGVLFFPTFHTTAMFKNTGLINMIGADYMLLFNILGFPATQVPVGLNKQGLPTGFQVIAAPYQDYLCLKVAAELENGFGGWIPPYPNEI